MPPGKHESRMRILTQTQNHARRARSTLIRLNKTFIPTNDLIDYLISDAIEQTHKIESDMQILYNISRGRRKS